MPQWIEKKSVVFASMLLMAVLMLHACQQSTYYGIDDELHLRASLGESWSDLSVTEISAMPLARLSYRLDYALFAAPVAQPDAAQDPGKAPLPEGWAPWIRRMNALYHVLAGMALWMFLRRIGVSAGLAFFVALAWAGHPTACESVCWVSERKNVLTALFGFGALLAWTLPQPKFKWPAVYALFGAALFCKASAIAFIPLIFALEVLNPLSGGVEWRSASRWFKAGLKVLVPVLLGLSMALLTVKNHERELVDPPGGSLLTALMTDTVIFGRYVINALIPVHLSFLYGIKPVISFVDVRVWMYGVALVAVFAAMIFSALKENRKLALFGVIWFFAGLGPNSNIISTPFWMQDRYTYVALPGLLLAAGLAVRGICARFSSPRALSSISAGWLLMLTVLLAVRASYFRDDTMLAIHAARQEPLAGPAHLWTARHFRSLWNQNRRNPELEKIYGEATYAEFAQALLCPDLRNFEEPFRVRNFGVEILLQRGLPQPARDALKDWLPPKNMVMLNVVKNVDKVRASRRVYLRGYFPQTLAHAWCLMAESSLLQSFEPGRDPQQRVDLCKRAVQETEQSMAVHENEFEGAFAKARALLQLSYMEAEKGDAAAADEHYASGVKMLQSVPAECLNGPSAAAMLKNAKPPKVAPAPLLPLPPNGGAQNPAPEPEKK